MTTDSTTGTPTQPDPLPYDALDILRTDGVGLLELVTDHGMDHPVPSCPSWDLGDLTWHVGNVWTRWARIVADQLTTLEAVEGLEPPERPSNDLLLDWVSTAHAAIFSALSSTDEAAEVWTWTGANRPTSWVRRRMVHETAVHRWDAATAVGSPYEIPAAVAADGIDEFLMWFATRRPHDGASTVDGSVHLHCTDTASGLGEWLVSRLDASGIAFTREHAKGDTAVRGRASDLLLWLWGRSTDGVEILGDTALAERFRSFPTL